MNDILAAHFQALCARIIAEVQPHSVIMVTSAQAGDGVRLTAFGLAESLAAAGHATALVDATANPDAAAAGRFRTKGPRDFPIYALPKNDGTSSRARDAIETFAGQAREEFAFTIVDAPPFGHQSVTMTLAGTADAVLIAVRLGRQPVSGDELMVRTLGTAGARLLGVVATTPESIEHFERSGSAQYLAESRSHATETAVIRRRQAS